MIGAYALDTVFTESRKGKFAQLLALVQQHYSLLTFAETMSHSPIHTALLIFTHVHLLVQCFHSNIHKCNGKKAWQH